MCSDASSQMPCMHVCVCVCSLSFELSLCVMAFFALSVLTTTLYRSLAALLPRSNRLLPPHSPHCYSYSFLHLICCRSNTSEESKQSRCVRVFCICASVPLQMPKIGTLLFDELERRWRRITQRNGKKMRCRFVWCSPLLLIVTLFCFVRSQPSCMHTASTSRLHLLATEASPPSRRSPFSLSRWCIHFFRSHTSYFHCVLPFAFCLYFHLRLFAHLVGVVCFEPPLFECVAVLCTFLSSAFLPAPPSAPRSPATPPV